MEYASKGMAGAGLGLGIAGTTLGILNGGAGLLGAHMANAGCNTAAACSEDQPVNRYEMTLTQAISSKDGEIALLKSERYTDERLVEVYKDLNRQINAVNEKIQANRDEQNAVNCQQAVFNGTMTSTVGCLQQQIACLQSLTKVVIPKDSVCPEPMDRYNSWTAPTTGGAATA